MTTLKQQHIIYTYIANFLYKKLKKRTNIAWINLDFVYENRISKEEKEKIIKKCYLNHMYAVMHFFKNKNMPIAKMLKNVKFVNKDIVQKAINEKRKIIFVNYHYGVWENVFLLPVSAESKTIVNMSQSFQQQALQDIVHSTRTQYGLKVVSQSSNTKNILTSLKNDNIISLFVDQSMPKKNSVEVEFLGKKTYTTRVPALFARSQDAVIIPVVYNTKDFHTHTITFCEIISIDKNLEKEEDLSRMSALYTKVLEKEIQKDAGLWLWIHRRWSNEYPHIYKNI